MQYDGVVVYRQQQQHDYIQLYIIWSTSVTPGPPFGGATSAPAQRIFARVPRDLPAAGAPDAAHVSVSAGRIAARARLHRGHPVPAVSILGRPQNLKIWRRGLEVTRDPAQVSSACSGLIPSSGKLAGRSA